MLFSRLTLTRSRVAAVCAGALVASALAVVGAGGASADGYPGQDEIAAARAAAESQAATVGELDAVVANLEEALSDAEEAQLLAADRYAQALDNVDTANANLATASKRAEEADAALAEAQAQLAAVAQAAYRDGGGMGQLGAVMTADGFDEAVTTSEVLARASDETATTVQRVEAAQLVADTMRTAANTAAADALAAEQAASDAFDDATAAAASAEQAVKDAAAVREEAVNRLAALRGTTVALEQQRQDGLAALRDQERREAALAAQEQAERDAEINNQGGSTPPKGTDPKPGTTTEPKPGTTTDPKPGTTTDPKPEETTDPKPTSSPKPTTSPKPDPKPEPTEQPKPPTTSGGWKSTASQGETAVTKALTLMGLPYKLGGSGPSAYDCSGLTQAAWKAAGIAIQRSSQWQYNTTKHVAFSQLRKGDLIFYGTDRDPSKIYHVAIYIGGGMVAEATKPGSLSVVRAYDASWRIDNLIPVAGRP